MGGRNLYEEMMRGMELYLEHLINITTLTPNTMYSRMVKAVTASIGEIVQARSKKEGTDLKGGDSNY